MKEDNTSTIILFVGLVMLAISMVAVTLYLAKIILDLVATIN